MEHEIYSMMKLMHEKNLYPTTFAYPYGTRNETTDSLLLEKFSLLRGTTRKSGFFNIQPIAQDQRRRQRGYAFQIAQLKGKLSVSDIHDDRSGQGTIP